MVNLGRIHPGLLKNKLQLVLKEHYREGSGVNNGKNPTDRRNRVLLISNCLFRGPDGTRVNVNSVFVSLRQALPLLEFLWRPQTAGLQNIFSAIPLGNKFLFPRIPK